MNDSYDYSSTENYIQSLKDGSKTNGRQSNESDGRTTNASDIIRGTVQRIESSNREHDSTGRGAEQSFSSTYGDVEDTNGSPGTIAEQLGEYNNWTARNNGSTYKHIRTDAAGKPRTGFSIKNAFTKYKDAIKGESRVVESDSKKSTSTKKQGSKLSDAEGLRLRPKMIEYMEWQTEHMDQFIIATVRGHDPSIIIWSDMSIDEIEIIVDFLIERGKRDSRTAQAVRYASVLMDRLRLGLILGPRVYKTLMIYIERGLSLR